MSDRPEYVLYSDYCAVLADRDRLAAGLAAEQVKVQRLRGLNARRNIEIGIIDSLLGAEDYEPSALDMEYWHDTHDKVNKVVRELAQARAALEQFVSVGWQYKFPSIWGGVVWRDSPNDHNGSRYVESREIFARRATDSAGSAPNPDD